MKASALYYKTKLIVHNFTIFDLRTKDGYCFLWDESEGLLSANEFASIICYFISKIVCFEEGEEILFYSDGCCHQNRNITLSNALLNLSAFHGITIIQKFLEKGHTQMECDSMHSMIEKRLRNQDIYSPSGYLDACKHARRNPRPYIVKRLHHNFFRNYSKAPCSFYKSLRPGNKAGDPMVIDMRAIRYNPNETIEYKLRHSDGWSLLPQRKQRNAKKCPIVEVPKLNDQRLKIRKEKWQHLQQLKCVLEQEFHYFYDTLPHE